MKKYTGKSANDGIAIGKIVVYRKKEPILKQTQFLGIEHEKARYDQVRTSVKNQLQIIFEKAKKDIGEESAEIIGIQLMLLEDQDYVDEVYRNIESDHLNAEAAIMTASKQIANLFAEMEDEYMKARATDIKDISDRLISELTGDTTATLILMEPAILFAEDLTPSETIQLDKSKILAFVTRDGSTLSHTAILARMMNIPAIVGTNQKVTDEDHQKLAIVDGKKGEVIIDPDERSLEIAWELKQMEEEVYAVLCDYKDKETKTQNGKKIHVYANIGDFGDIPEVLENDAEGIGLFRSECLYLGRDTLPTEEEQFLVYKKVAEAMNGKKVIIRTFDIGADKQVSYLNLDQEENPALGYRAIRICLDRPSLFVTQLRAIYRASVYGQLGIMYPMIISLSEVQKIKEIVAEVKRSLHEEGYIFNDIEQGIMIETPAAVFESDVLAQEVDFFSIGTNDLTQYTLAIDRQNAKLEAFYDAHHPAVLKMIQMVIDNGHKENCWVGICGELGADLALTETFVKMGIDELSVAPKFVLPIRKIICNIDSTPQH